MRTAMMAITTRSSMSVKACRRIGGEDTSGGRGTEAVYSPLAVVTMASLPALSLSLAASASWRDVKRPTRTA